MAKGICSVDGCEKPSRARGYCNLHWGRWHRTGNLGSAGYVHHPLPQRCVVEGCPDRPKAKGYCNKHYLRWKNHGDPSVGSRSSGRTWNDKDGYVVTWDPRTGYGSGRAVREHRLVMEQMIGRPLMPFETVHHLNGIRDPSREP